MSDQNLNWKNATAATAAQVRAATSIFMVAAGSNMDEPLKVTNTVMAEVFGKPTEIAKVEDATITGWHDTSTHAFDDDDWVFVQLVEEDGSQDTLQIGPMQFKNIATTYNRVGNIDGAPMNFVATVTNVPDENDATNYKTLITDGATGQYIAIQAQETAGNRLSDNWEGRFEDLATAENQAPWMLIGTSGNRFQAWRNGSDVRTNRAGPVNASNRVTLYRAGKKQELRIRRTGTKLRYHLQGEISTNNILYVVRL